MRKKFQISIRQLADKSQISNKKHFPIGHLTFSRGFTIIETLVTLGIVITIGGTIGGILFAMSRGVNKSNTSTIVRQNGEAALSQIVKAVRIAQTFQGVSINNSSYVTDCSPVGPTPPPGGYKYIKVTDFNNIDSVISCNDASSTITVDNASIIDTQNVQTVSCAFSCSQSSTTNTPSIMVQFTLKRKGTTAPDNQAQLNFQTTVVPRNVQ